MRTWLILLGGFLIWTFHFFALYGIGEFVGETIGPRVAVIALTLASLLGVGGLMILLRRMTPRDDLERWRYRAASGLMLISFIAIVWQGFPALFVP